MGEHRQALDIYVFKLKDPEKAEESVPVTAGIDPCADFIIATATTFTSLKHRCQRQPLGPGVFPAWMQTLIRLPFTILC